MHILRSTFLFLVSVIVFSCPGWSLFSICPKIKYRPHIESWKAYQDSPFLVELQEGSYNSDSKILDIFGECTLRHGYTQLECTKLLYDQNKDEVKVWDGRLKDTFGDRVFFDHGVLNSTLRSGTLHNVRILTYLQERVTARKMIKTSTGKIRGERVAYTPCHTCKDTLEEPLWSLHGAVVEQDQNLNETEYIDATLKLKGVPLAHIPYFYLPTKARSGFLAPYVGSNVGAGFYTGTPYYWRMAPFQDFKVTPFYMTQGGEMLASEYRRRFHQGEVSLSGAGNVTSKKQSHDNLRGYSALDLKSHFSPRWRLFMHEYIASDRTFFTTRPFFGFTSDPYLESKTGVEGFYPKHWFSIRTLRYQDLSPEGTTEGSCAVAPEIKYAYSSPIFKNIIFANVQAGTVSLYRKEGTQMQRGTVDMTAEHRVLLGADIHTSAHLGQALYSAQLRSMNESLSNMYALYSQTAVGKDSQSLNTQYYRIFPEIQSTLRYPVYHSNWSFVPIFQCVGAPSGVNSWRIPNQDSQNVEFHDENLFAKSRFSGLDRVDDGSKLNYAAQLQCALNTDHKLEWYIGQRYSLSSPAKELQVVGVRKGFSDIVGRMMWKGPFAKLLYRIRVHPSPLRSQVHMIGGSVGTPLLECSGNYMFFALEPVRKILTNQATLQIKSNLFTRYWHVRCFVTQNFNTQFDTFFEQRKTSKSPLNQGVGVGYEDECFIFDFFVQYSRYRMGKDLRPGTSFGINIHFKNLGQVRTSKQIFSRKPDQRQTDSTVSYPDSSGNADAFFPI